MQEITPTYSIERGSQAWEVGCCQTTNCGVGMYFYECDFDGHRIFAGAVELNGGGYAAAVAVEAQPGSVFYFNDRLLKHRLAFLDPNEALRFAVIDGQRAVESKRRTAARTARSRAASQRAEFGKAGLP